MHTSQESVFWLITGSQHLYGDETLRAVADHARQMGNELNADPALPYPILVKPVVTHAAAIEQVCREANADAHCAGVITWMHTFSPAKMWIGGLLALQQPLLHFHTQFNRDIPWETLDMDFMNLNQSAHGDREFGFLTTRMQIARKVVAGHWQDPQTRHRIGQWMRTAVGWQASRHLKVARFGDNMREVAVTEGDKVEAQIRLGWDVQGYGVGDLVRSVHRITEQAVDVLLDEYGGLYEISDEARHTPDIWHSIRTQARLELGIQQFMDAGGFEAFTTTFEDLHGLDQLPGLAAQRLMAAGYGFGAEGDWKTAALLRVMKVMADNRGTSFMEDYTYHWDGDQSLILGSHMLEVCPSIAASQPRVAVYPLTIGGKDDPARLIFDGHSGAAVCASLVDLGTRFRLVVNEVEAVTPPHAMPRLPVARVLWKPQPSLPVAAESWIYAGGSHHSVFSYHVTADQLRDWADLSGIECVVINRESSVLAVRDTLRWNDLYYQFHSTR